MPSRIAFSVLAPNPFSSRTRPASQACLQVVQRLDAQLVEHGGRFLRADPRNPHDGQDAFRDLGQQFVQLRQLPGADQRGRFLRDGFADAVDRQQPLPVVGHDRRHGLGQVADGPGAVAVGPHAKRVLVFEFQQVRNLLQDGGDFGVGHGCIRAAEGPAFGARGPRRALVMVIPRAVRRHPCRTRHSPLSPWCRRGRGCPRRGHASGSGQSPCGSAWPRPAAFRRGGP